MIYFDSNKKAYGHDIKDCVCSIDDETWGKYVDIPGSWDIVNGAFVALIDVDLQEAKNIKLFENSTKRNTALIAGVTYKDVLFDSDQDQKINLIAAINSMSDSDTIVWYGKDGISSLICFKTDLEAIGTLITTLTSNIWSNLNPSYINQINTCTTIAEVNAIQINYGE